MPLPAAVKAHQMFADAVFGHIDRTLPPLHASPAALAEVVREPHSDLADRVARFVGDVATGILPKRYWQHVARELNAELNGETFTGCDDTGCEACRDDAAAAKDDE